MQKKTKKKTESLNRRVSKTNNGKTLILSKRTTSGAKKSRFIKKQEVKVLSSKVPLLGDILF